VPFTIHEDPQVNIKAAASENLSRNNVENQKPLLLKNETNINEAKVITYNILQLTNLLL